MADKTIHTNPIVIPEPSAAASHWPNAGERLGVAKLTTMVPPAW